MTTKELLWNWTNYKVLVDDISKEHIIEMLADIHERLLKLEKENNNDS